MGVAESNLLLLSDIAAYQSLKRLRIEEIESGLKHHYDSHLDEFPFPPTLAKQLIKSARPLHHYLAMRSQLRSSGGSGGAKGGSDKLASGVGDMLCDGYHNDVDPWKVLRLLDANPPFTPAESIHVKQKDLNFLADVEILERVSDFEFQFTDRFHQDIKVFLESSYESVSMDRISEVSIALIPDFFVYQGKLFLPQS